MSEYKSLRVAYGNDDPADIDDGVVAIPAAADRKFTVVDVWMRATGSMVTATSVDVTDGTTIFASFEDTALTNAALVRIGAANTAATNLGTAAIANTAISVGTVGSDIGTTTALEWCVFYTVESVAG